MSLVICSNELQNNSLQPSQSPFSWSNYLDQPLHIPPNSEVAVQSVKINKDGSISASPSNVWYMYVGELLRAGVNNYEEVSSSPAFADLNLKNAENFTTETLAERIQDGLNKAMAIPDMWGYGKVSVLRDTDNLDFQGFTFNTNCSENASLLDPLSSGMAIDNYIKRFKFPDSNIGIVKTGASALRKYTAAGTGEPQLNQGTTNIGILTDLPMALNGGEFIVDITAAAGLSYGIGLTRSTQLDETPSNFVDFLSDMPEGQGFFAGDYYISVNQDKERVSGANRFLRVFHMVVDERDFEDPTFSRTRNSSLRMREVKYYEAGSDSFFDGTGTPYNMSTNLTNSKISKFKFQTTNESLTAFIWAGEVGFERWEKLISEDDILAPVVVDKGLKFKPIVESTRALYPLLYVRDSSVGGTDKSLQVEKFSAHNNTIEGKQFTYGENDWYSRCLSRGNPLQIQEVDTRPYMNYFVPTGAGLVPPDYTRKLINASGLLDNSTAMIVKPSTQYRFTKIPRALTSSIFGFPNVSVVAYNGNVEFGLSVTSESVPILKTTTSLFVRLNNFNVSSYNAGQSKKSSILYSIPRFASGTNESVGALFFESPERVYIKLNNPNTIQAQSFNLDIVNEDETLARDLLGKSVIILHFRESR